MCMRFVIKLQFETKFFYIIVQNEKYGTAPGERSYYEKEQESCCGQTRLCQLRQLCESMSERCHSCAEWYLCSGRRNVVCGMRTVRESMSGEYHPCERVGGVRR